MRCPVLVSALTCDPSSGSGSAVDPESETVCDPASVTSCGHGTATGGIGDPSCGPARTSVACPCRSSDPPLTPSSATPRRQPQRHPRRLVPPVPAGSPPLPWSPARALARPNKGTPRGSGDSRGKSGTRISKPTLSKSYFSSKVSRFFRTHLSTREPLSAALSGHSRHEGSAVANFVSRSNQSAAAAGTSVCHARFAQCCGKCMSFI